MKDDIDIKLLLQSTNIATKVTMNHCAVICFLYIIHVARIIAFIINVYSMVFSIIELR